ncbi:MAG: right-handed parallel beta-helix repeat-containing protein [bacterium]|nr:right-handed parallel beta-helix repeat-containing protein [bacterium]
MKSLLFVLFSLVIAASSFGDTLVSGEVQGEWTIEGSPYIAVGNLVLTADDTLIINAGVIVKFQAARAFSISGRFECLGEVGDSVYFTQETADPEDRWLGLNFYGTNDADTSIVRYAVIENAGSYNGALQVQTPHLIFEHNTIRNCLGRGIKVRDQTIEIRDCAILNNSGGSCGGGIVTQQSDVTFRRCLIADNSAQDGGGSCSFNGSITFDSCTFSRNSGSIWAGAIFADSVNVTLTNCLFDSNYASDGGVGWIVDDSRARIDRCVFKENVAIHSDGHLGSHGALYMTSPGPQHVTNCLFIGNRGIYGNAMNVLCICRELSWYCNLR